MAGPDTDQDVSFFVVTRLWLCYIFIASQSLDSACSQDVAAVDHDRLPIEILVRGREEHRTRHILVLARPARRHLLLVLLPGDKALLLLIALPRSHLTGKHPRGDIIYADLQFGRANLMRQHLGQMDRRRLGCIVRKMMLRDLDNPRDRRDVDYRAGPAVLLLGPLGQQRQERRGGEEQLRHVCPEHVLPFLGLGGRVVKQALPQLGGLLVLHCLRVAGDSGVVDQDGEMRFARGDLLHELLD